MADSFPRADIARNSVESVTLHFLPRRPKWPTIHKDVQLLTTALNGRDNYECDKRNEHNENSLQIIALKNLTVCA
jgi:hypothetical protein